MSAILKRKRIPSDSDEDEASSSSIDLSFDGLNAIEPKRRINKRLVKKSRIEEVASDNGSYNDEDSESSLADFIVPDSDEEDSADEDDSDVNDSADEANTGSDKSNLSDDDDDDDDEEDDKDPISKKKNKFKREKKSSSTTTTNLVAKREALKKILQLDDDNDDADAMDIDVSVDAKDSSDSVSVDALAQVPTSNSARAVQRQQAHIKEQRRLLRFQEKETNKAHELQWLQQTLVGIEDWDASAVPTSNVMESDEASSADRSEFSSNNDESSADDDDDVKNNSLLKGTQSAKERDWRLFILDRTDARRAQLIDMAKNDRSVAQQLRRVALLKEETEKSLAPLGDADRKRQQGVTLVGLLQTPENANQPFVTQLSGIAFMMFRETLPYKNCQGGILSDEMGLGKTLKVLMLVATDRVSGYHAPVKQLGSTIPTHAPTLIVTPTQLLRTWVDEAKKRFDPSTFNIIVLHETYTAKWRTSIKAKDIVDRDIIIINIEGLRRLYKELLIELLNDIYTNPSRYRPFMNILVEEERDRAQANGFGSDAEGGDGDDNDDDADDAVPTFGGGLTVEEVRSKLHGTSPLDDDDDADNNDAIKIAARPVNGASPEVERMAKKLTARNLDVGFKTIWADTRKWRAAHTLFGMVFRRSVQDECTQSKNDSTINFHAMRAIRAVNHWSVSGTPIENHVDELFSQLRILKLDQTTHSISDKAAWHRLTRTVRDVSSNESRIVLDPLVATKLKQRFMNVLQLRREVNTANGTNPLAPYLARASCSEAESQLWDIFVNERIAAKRDRIIERERLYKEKRSRHLRRAGEQIQEERAEAQTSFLYDELGTLLGVSSSASSMQEDASGNGIFKVRTTLIEQKRLAAAEVLAGAWWNLSLNDLVRYRLTAKGEHKAAELALDNAVVPRGFYWYTSQARIQAAMKRVDHWMRECFDISLEMLHHAIENARVVIKTRGIGVNVTPEDNTAVERAIHTSLAKDLKVSFDEEHGQRLVRLRFKVIPGLMVPKPILFVAQQHPLEKAVYDDSLRMARHVKDMDASGETRQTRQNLAFTCITQLRSGSLDYKTSSNAPDFLQQSMGTAWNTDGREPFDLVKRSDLKRQYQAEEEAEIANIGIGANEFTPLSPPPPPPSTYLGGGNPSVNRSNNELLKMPKRVATKALMLLRYVMAIPEDDKVIAFTDLVAFVPNVVAFFNSRGIHTISFVGSMAQSARDIALEKFRETGKHTPRLMFASMRCVSMGLNIQEANHSVMFSIWYNGSFEEQSKRRTLRPGQLKPVFFVYLLIELTIEELVLARGGEKSDMISLVVGGYDGVIQTSSNFSRPDITRAHVMEFEQGPYGPLIPAEGWPEKTMADLEAMPIKTIGGRFSSINISQLISDRGKLDHAKIATALIDV